MLLASQIDYIKNYFDSTPISFIFFHATNSVYIYLVAFYNFWAGGWHASTENTNKVERFDPNTNKWELKSPLNERRYRPGVAVVDGKIYVCGGEEGWDRYDYFVELRSPV